MQKLLASLITDDEFERIQLILKEPNIFSALSVNRMEIRHSNFIGYLLDPNENHGLKDLVLKKVLRGVFQASKSNQRNIIDADYLDYSNVEIRREWRNIDILIVLAKDVVVIENKIDSTDHSDQLARYKKIVEESFDNKNYYIHFVYLTPFGDDPNDESVRNDYINYSYENISIIIESIITIYRNSLSEKIYFYLSDYLTVLKRELLMNDTLNADARKVYIKHKDAIDFIIENIPNPINEFVYPAFEEALVNEGYLIRLKSTRIIRFTTKELDQLLPINQGSGWKTKEIFLFEIKFAENEVEFLATISPGNEITRDAIHQAIKKSSHYKKSTSRGFQLLVKKRYEFSPDKIGEQSNNDIKEEAKKIVELIKPIADEVSNLIAINEAVKDVVKLSN